MHMPVHTSNIGENIEYFVHVRKVEIIFWDRLLLWKINSNVSDKTENVIYLYFYNSFLFCMKDVPSQHRTSGHVVIKTDNGYVIR